MFAGSSSWGRAGRTDGGGRAAGSKSGEVLLSGLLFLALCSFSILDLMAVCILFDLDGNLSRF